MGEQLAESAHTLRRTYDLLAERYARINAGLPEQVRVSGEVFLAHLPQTRVLDVGCGHGRDMDWLAGRGCRVIGLDFSAGMLRQAWPRSLVQGDMQRQPFPGDAFGGVWCNATLLHLPKRLAPLALAEMRRVLSQRGMLFLSLQGGQGEAWESSSYGLALPRFFARYTRDEAMRLLGDHGFALVHYSEAAQNPRRFWLHFVAEAV